MLWQDLQKNSHEYPSIFIIVSVCLSLFLSLFLSFYIVSVQIGTVKNLKGR